VGLRDPLAVAAVGEDAAEGIERHRYRLLAVRGNYSVGPGEERSVTSYSRKAARAACRASSTAASLIGLRRMSSSCSRRGALDDLVQPRLEVARVSGCGCPGVAVPHQPLPLAGEGLGLPL